MPIIGNYAESGVIIADAADEMYAGKEINHNVR